MMIMFCNHPQITTNHHIFYTYNAILIYKRLLFNSETKNSHTKIGTKAAALTEGFFTKCREFSPDVIKCKLLYQAHSGKGKPEPV